MLLVIGVLLLLFVYWKKETISEKTFKRWRLIGGVLVATGVIVPVAVAIVGFVAGASGPGGVFVYTLF